MKRASKNFKLSWNNVLSMYKKRESKYEDTELENIEKLDEETNHYSGRLLTIEILRRNIRHLLLEKIRHLKRSDNLFIRIESNMTGRDDFKKLSKVELNYAFLWAAFLGSKSYMETAHGFGADVYCTVEPFGYTALHLSTVAGSMECVQWLVERKSNVNAIANELSLVHYAVLVHSVNLVRYLISVGSRVMDTTLHSAVSVNAIKCIHPLKNAGVQVNAKDSSGMTALHIAAERGNIQSMEILLDFPDINVNVKNDSDGLTALHLAATEGYAECIQLLLQKGAKIDEKSYKEKTALFYASKTEYVDCVEMLLKYGAKVNELDLDNKTALHAAVSKSKFSIEVVQLLIKWNADINIADRYGFTPLHIAALNELTECVEFLIIKGANVAASTNGGVSALNIMNRKTPTSVSAITTRLSAALAYTTQKTLKFCFRDIISNSNIGEIGFLYQLKVENNSEILKHPLCRAFLYLKWQKIRRYYLLRMTILFLLTALYSFHVMGTGCSIRAKSNITADDKPNCECSRYNSNLTKHTSNRSHTCTVVGIEITENLLRYSHFCMAILLVISLIRVVFSFAAYRSVRHYLSNTCNILLWFTIILGTTLVTQITPFEYFHSIGALTVLSSWTYLMLRIAQLPYFGTYVAMYTRVQKQFSKLLLAYIFLLIGFAISFCILFPTNDLFKNPLIAFVKVLGMMTGELEIKELTPPVHNHTRQHHEHYSIMTVYIVLLLFIIFVTVILMNLLVGVAVNNVEELQKLADLMMLEQQTSLIYYTELACFHGLIPKRIADIIRRLVYVSPKGYRVVMYVRPFSPEEKRLPKDIMQDGLAAALERKKVDTNVQGSIDKRLSNIEKQIGLLYSILTKESTKHDKIKRKTESELRL